MNGCRYMYGGSMDDRWMSILGWINELMGWSGE